MLPIIYQDIVLNKGSLQTVSGNKIKATQKVKQNIIFAISYIKFQFYRTINNANIYFNITVEKHYLQIIKQGSLFLDIILQFC